MSLVSFLCYVFFYVDARVCVCARWRFLWVHSHDCLLLHGNPYPKKPYSPSTLAQTVLENVASSLSIVHGNCNICEYEATIVGERQASRRVSWRLWQHKESTFYFQFLCVVTANDAQMGECEMKGVLCGRVEWCVQVDRAVWNCGVEIYFTRHILGLTQYHLTPQCWQS